MCSFSWRSELHESNAIGIYRFAEGHNIEGLRWFYDYNVNGDDGIGIIEVVHDMQVQY